MKIVYSKDDCPRCDQLIRKLQLAGERFKIIKLDTPEKVAEFKASFPKVRAVPFVMEEDDHSKAPTP